MKKIFPWGAIVAVAILLSGAFSVWLEARQASRAALRYVGIWETEIARSLLMRENVDQTAKILEQIEEVHPALRMPSGDRCDFPITRTISLYALPAKDLVVCRDSSTLVSQGLLSPSFFGLLLAVGILISMFLRREYRQELRRLAAEARAESESRLGQLSREVAHDIRGPLSALQALASHAKSISGPEKEMLQRASARISSIAEDLLSRSRNSGASVENKIAENIARTLSVRAEVLSLDETLGSLASELARRFPSHGVEFSLQSHAMISMSGTVLLRLVSNLVQNAVDASEPGKKITIATRGSSDSAILTIADEGKGIPADLLARLGREEVTYAKQNGNGLGVLSAKRAVEAAGGSFAIRSKEGVGTQVELKFPRA